MVRIFTDSTSDISQKEAAALGITVVPLKVIFSGEEALREGVDISLEEFYGRLPKANPLPTTSQPAPDDFCTHFLEAKQAGDSVVVITIAHTLSGTYQSACIAKEMAEYDQIHVVDSLNASAGVHLLVDEALRLRDQENKSAEEIAAALTELVPHVRLFALVDTLENLHKGGRLSRTSSIAGTLLNFKPIITVKDGALSSLGKARGTANGIEKMFEEISAVGEIDTNYPIYFGYAFTRDKADICHQKAVEHFSLTNTKFCSVGCVIGTHLGAGACLMTMVLRGK